MYLECGKCGSPKLKFTGIPEYTMYCQECLSFLKENQIKQYQTLASQMSSNSYKSLLVKWTNVY